MSGYARLHRSLLGHAAFRNDAEAMAFAWLVLRASWKPARVRYKGRAVALDRGQLAVSVRDLAEAMDRDKGWVERLLKRLRSATMIETRTETGVLVVTICNYAKYQASPDNDETVDETARETQARQTQDTEQRREEGKKVEEVVETSSQPVVSASDVREALDIWNDTCAATGWARVIKFTPSRQQHLRARLRDDGLQGWRSGLERARASPLLNGQPPPTWFDFDFIVKTGNFAKLIEGKYDREFTRNDHGGTRGGSTRAAAAAVFDPFTCQDPGQAVIAARRIGFAGS